MVLNLFASDSLCEDRREHPRREARFFGVLRRFIDDEDMSLPQCAYVLNISAGGALICSHRGVREGDRVALTIYTDNGWTGGGVSPRLEVEGIVQRVMSDQCDYPSGALDEVAIQLIREPALLVMAKESRSLSRLGASIHPA